MTAETLVAKRAKGSFPAAGIGMGGDLKCAFGTYEIAAAVETGDIFEMCKLPAGAVVVHGLIYGDDIDTGTEALDFDIGWKATDDEVTDTDGFGNLGTITGDVITDLKPEVSIFYPFGGVLRTAGPKLFTAPATLQVYVNTASNAGHVGTLTMVVFYVVDPNYVV